MGCGFSSEHHNGLWFEDPTSKAATRKLKEKGLLRDEEEDEMRAAETFFDDRPEGERTPEHLKDDVRHTLRLGMVKNTRLMQLIHVDEVNEMINTMVKVRVLEEDTVFEIGEPADHCFVIESGEYEIWKPDLQTDGEMVLETTISHVGAFGEGALFGLPRNLTVTVKKAGNLWALTKSSVDILLERRAELEKNSKPKS
mmetsp:Transcript_23909/g.32886  ORF Transcript_23909/g.32886 Transcript_23909/m.32886 type:complete len:198 (-) Transcript_23909:159-752(-)|eukprot:CAMPEP_0196587922 /NCGR_PEP_ID=MMETSP1081-20130531/59035_1 /TAXON_ID=36882 /ORGANISM="Pyramimonas amylifera, Strain CCMP720" /LENGTH=197 /DNA_ID=CAMNT_0041910259 /DNA_START=593 /DNA_END=1186 /DNA_ORIENTATION=-